MAHVTAKDVVVEFPIYGTKSRSLKHTFIRAATGGVLARDAADRVVVKALNHINFEFKEGDRVGIVGHNGSGKSTLLRVIAGTYEPVHGEISVEGKVASMLSIAVGMESEATGLENIYLRGTVMGLKPKQIEALVDGIAEFSELGDYLQMPLRTFSSGMYMRLAFAISTSVPADIIVMDEWLSVGDAAFSEKAQQRMHDMIGRSKILFLASHDETLIRKNCNAIIRLERGQLVSSERLN
jgi:lipopolysaccharide transport system ATP-binding protein